MDQNTRSQKFCCTSVLRHTQKALAVAVLAMNVTRDVSVDDVATLLHVAAAHVTPQVVAWKAQMQLLF